MNHSQNSQLPEVLFLMGPTASGKTALAMKLHEYLPVEIISVDSALIYRGMDIGTAKPSVEEQARVPHRLLDICEPTESYSAAQFRHNALNEIKQIIDVGKIPLLVGGTMLYFKALLNGLSPLPAANANIRSYLAQMASDKGWPALHQWLAQCDPTSAERIHPNDPQRLSRALEVFLVSGKTLTELTQISGSALPYRVTQYAIVPSTRDLLHQRITARFHKMLQSGFEAEVRSLIARGDLNINMPSMRCVGYRQMWFWLTEEISYDEMVFQALCATRQFAKRQLTWLRGWKDLIWLDSEQLDKACETVRQVYCTRCG